MVRSFEEYCEIIAMMKSAHDPKMNIVSSMFSNADFPPLIGNKVAHRVKADFCNVNADFCKSDGTAEDKAHVGSIRHGGTQSTKHAYSEAEGRDQGHAEVGSEDRGIKRVGSAVTCA